MGLGAHGKLQMRNSGANTDYTLASCPLYHPPNGTLDLAALDDDTVDWFQTTKFSI